MKKIVALLAVIFVFAALTFGAFADTFDGTMVRSNNADPNLFFHDGYYYLTQTGTSRIAVFKTKQLEKLETLSLGSNISYTAYLNGEVYDPTVIELFGEGAAVNGTWSPEIHYFSEDQFPGNSGWYMFLALRKDTGDSSLVRMVVLKSTTDSPKGPYGHPTSGTKNHSQPVLDQNGNVWDVWACGQTVLTIPEGPYKGTYTMWVAEEGRGQSGANGSFYQKIMIAKMKSPWQFDGTPGIVTTPTQAWEYAGASNTHPRVVEGATPVYGKNGEIFITYSGSGYWSDYGLGQLTWNGGDPLKTSSWVKLSTSRGNPIFSAVNAKNLRGAGHASFLTDTSGNGFVCYHAYAYDPETGKKATSRDAYIEPYYIDYTKWNGVSYGVIKIGLNGDGIPADTASKVTFATDGKYLTPPDFSAEGGKKITLTMSESGATGYLIYKSTDNKTFNYLTTVDAGTYTDIDVAAGNTYYYRAYAYREEEISDVSATVSADAIKLEAPTFSVYASCEKVRLEISSSVAYSSYNIYRSTDNSSFSKIGTSTGDYTDKDIVAGTTYYYRVTGVYGADESAYLSYALPVQAKHFAESADGLDATCTDDGYTAYTYCFNCNEVLSGKDVIPATGHIDTDTVTVDATCTEDGSVTVTCKCGVVVSTKVLPATGHIDTTETTADATCTDDGSVTVTCKCGVVVSTEVIPAKGHSYEITEEEIPATTTSVGKTAVYTCGGCGDSYGGEEIPMLDSFTMAGDVNRDGVVNILDVLRMAKAIVGENVSTNMYNADINGNGIVDIEDMVSIIYIMLNTK